VAPKPTKAQIQAVERLVRQQVAAVDGLAPSALKAVTPVLQDVRKELARDLSAWVSSVPDGAERYTAQRMRVALRAAEAALERAKDLAPAMGGALEVGSGLAGAVAVANLETEIARFGAVFGESLSIPNINTAAVLARGEDLLWRRHESSAKRYAGAVGDDIRRQLAVGVAKGETFEQTVNRLRKLGGPRVSIKAPFDAAVGDEIAEGLFSRHRFWAERLVRTENMHAYNVQHEESILDANAMRAPGEDPFLRRWDASADSRLCPFCRALDGRLAPIGKPFASGVMSPPAHPCCRCIVLAWLERWGTYKTETEPTYGMAPPSKIQPSVVVRQAKPIRSSKPAAVAPPPPKPPKVKIVAQRPSKPPQPAAPVAKPPPPPPPPPIVAAPPEPVAPPSPPAPKPVRVAKAKPAPAPAPVAAPVEPPTKAIPKFGEEHTAAQKAAYEDEAFSQLEMSQRKWDRHVASGGGGVMTTKKEPGLTYSSKSFEKERLAFVQGLTPDEVQAGLFYSSKGDRILNSALRRGEAIESPRVAQKLADLDSAIAKSALSKDTVLTRGMKGDHAVEFAKSLRPGDTFVDAGYTSTSATRAYDMPVQIRINAKKGQAAAPIPSFYASEGEFLLPRGTRFRVVGNDLTPDGQHFLTLEIE